MSNYKISEILHAIKIIIAEMYPDSSLLGVQFPYSVSDIANQIMFEILKEEYKRYAPRNNIQYYLEKYDINAEHRKYTRAIQYAQHYKDCDNTIINQNFGIELPELMAQDVSGPKVFKGHSYTEQEFLQYKLQAECSLISKLHGHQIDSSKNVSETKFIELFSEYSNFIDFLEPAVNQTDLIIGRTFLYYGIETYFFTDFMYYLTLVAENHDFPVEIPKDRIQSIIGIVGYLPPTIWCPAVYIANNYMIMRWRALFDKIFVESDTSWQNTEKYIVDCKRMKSVILSCRLEQWIGFVHNCSEQEKADFILEHYWVWENRPAEYEWTPYRIQYFRKLHKSVFRDFPKPHIR